MITHHHLAEALDCFWNAAVGPERDGQQPAACVAQGLAAVATRLRELEASKGLETPRMLVLSTAHITEETSECLDNSAISSEQRVPLHFAKGEYGFLIPIIPFEPGDVEDRERWEAYPDLAAIRAVAEAAGCSWIMLDRDADTVDGLSTYDW